MNLRTEWMNESHAVDFDINARSNLSELVHVTVMEVTVSRARFRYTREYFALGICRLIKPAVMEKLMPYLVKIHPVTLWYFTSTVMFVLCVTAKSTDTPDLL